jgi:hypothetical protein
MHQLMIRHQTDPLGRRKCFVTQVEWRDADLNEIRRQRPSGTITVILKILKEDSDLRPRTIEERFFVESRRVLKRSDQERRQILMCGRVVNNPELFGFLRIKTLRLDLRCGEEGAAYKKEALPPPGPFRASGGTEFNFDRRGPSKNLESYPTRELRTQVLGKRGRELSCETRRELVNNI